MDVINKMTEIMRSVDRCIIDMDIKKDLSDNKFYDVVFHNVVADNCPNCAETEFNWVCNKFPSSKHEAVAICSRNNCPRMKCDACHLRGTDDGVMVCYHRDAEDKGRIIEWNDSINSRVPIKKCPIQW